MASDDQILKETLYQISVSGIFYGLGALSETILQYLERSRCNPEALVLGAALVHLAGGAPGEAVRVLDKSANGSTLEARVMKALALRRQGNREQSEKLLDSIEEDIPHPVRAMVEAVRAS